MTDLKGNTALVAGSTSEIGRATTIAWAAEYSPIGVRVNAISPGPKHTRMMEAVRKETLNHIAALAPADRVAEPEELAVAIVFLEGDDASFIRGVTLAVDGGRVAT